MYFKSNGWFISMFKQILSKKFYQYKTDQVIVLHLERPPWLFSFQERRGTKLTPESLFAQFRFWIFWHDMLEIEASWTFILEWENIHPIVLRNISVSPQFFCRLFLEPSGSLTLLRQNRTSTIGPQKAYLRKSHELS